MVHASNPSTQEAEAGRSVSSRPVWPTELAPGQPDLHREKTTPNPKPKPCLEKPDKETDS